jgi:hypothetical protein
MLRRTATEMKPADGGKLADLRAKTDRDLEILLGRMLERALHAASLSRFADAEAAYARGERLLPLLKGLPPTEFNSLESRVRELRAHLDSVTRDAWRVA